MTITTMISSLVKFFDKVGKDKLQHFTLAAMIAAVTKVILMFWLGYWAAAAIALGLVIVLSTLKEIYDKRTGDGTPEIADFIWGLMGGLFGSV